MNKKKYSIIDCFLNYQYKKPLTKNDGNYYFPKSEIVLDNKFSLNFKEFIAISTLFFDKLFNELLEGKNFKLPSNVGILELKKYKSNNSIDWYNTNIKYGEYNKLSKDKKFIYHKNIHTDGYKPILKWNKKKSKIKNKSFFKIEFVRKRNLELAKMYKEKPLLINKLNEI